MIIFSLSAFLPGLAGHFLFDDDIHFLQDEYINDPQGLTKIWWQHQAGGWAYWPISRSLLWLQFQFWGTETPAGYLLISLLLHGLIVGLLWFTLSEQQVQFALPLTLLYALHPLQVENVAWITQQKGLISMIFAVTALRFFLLGFKGNRLSHFVLAWLFYNLTLLSKSSVIGLAGVFALLCFYQRLKILRMITIITPFVISALLKIYIEVFSSWTHTTGATAPGLGVLELGRVIIQYLRLIFTPWELSFNYANFLESPLNWQEGLFILLIMSYLIYLMRHVHTSPKHLQQGLLLMAFILFFLPVSGVIYFGGLRYAPIADHWLQSALLPALALLLILGQELSLKILGRFSWRKQFEQGVIILVLILFWGISFQRSALFANPTRLYQHALEQNPDSWLASHLLGVIAMNEVKNQEALAYFNDSIQKQPNNPESYNNRGLLYRRLGQERLALADLDLALKWHAEDAAALQNRGNLRVALGQYDLGIEDLRKFLQFRQHSATGKLSLGIALRLAHLSQNSSLGEQRQESEYWLKQAQLQPDTRAQATCQLQLLQAQNALRSLPQDGRQKSMPMPDWEKSLTLEQVVECINERGQLYAQLQQLDMALGDWEYSISLQPEQAQAYVLRGVYLAKTRRLQEALIAFNLALRNHPNNSEALVNRGLCLQQLGRPQEALEDYSQALRKQIPLSPVNKHSLSLPQLDRQALRNRGLLYMQMQNRNLACQDWESACQLGDCQNLEIARQREDCP